MTKDKCPQFLFLASAVMRACPVCTFRYERHLSPLNLIRNNPRRYVGKCPTVPRLPFVRFSDSHRQPSAFRMVGMWGNDLLGKVPKPGICSQFLQVRGYVKGAALYRPRLPAEAHPVQFWPRLPFVRFSDGSLFLCNILSQYNIRSAVPIWNHGSFFTAHFCTI